MVIGCESRLGGFDIGRLQGMTSHPVTIRFLFSAISLSHLSHIPLASLQHLSHIRPAFLPHSSNIPLLQTREGKTKASVSDW